MEHFGSTGYVEKNGPDQQLRDDPRADDGPWDLRHKVPRKIRRIWTSPRVGTAAVPGHDRLGFLDGGQHPGSEGHDSSSGCHHRTGSSRPWKVGDCKFALPSRRRAGRGLHVETSRLFFKEQIFRTPGRSKVDYLRVGVHERDGRYHFEAPGVCAEAFYGSRSRRSRPEEATQSSSKEEGWKGSIQGRGRRDLGYVDPSLPCPRSSTEMHAALDGHMNPLEQEIEFTTWGLCLSRWILNSGTSLAWHLRKSFTAEWRGSSSSTATFPLPVPYPGCFRQSGPRLSKRRLEVLSQRRALHVAIIILNKLYLGRYATPEELGRRPNAWQWSRICKMRLFYVACGFVRELLPIAPGRSGPELGACLHQLERFLEVNPELAAAYRSHEAALICFKMILLFSLQKDTRS